MASLTRSKAQVGTAKTFEQKATKLTKQDGEAKHRDTEAQRKDTIPENFTVPA
jgi:hypothetical protein